MATVYTEDQLDEMTKDELISNLRDFNHKAGRRVVRVSGNVDVLRDEILNYQSTGTSRSPKIKSLITKLPTRLKKLPTTPVEEDIVVTPLPEEKCVVSNKECTEITNLEECEKACECVVYKNNCVSRNIEEASEINKDPDKWVKGVKTDELEKLVEFASYLYFNYDAGGLTDNSFDALEYHLNKRLKTKGRRYDKIGAEPLEKLKVRLPYTMPSLEKIKPGMISLLTYINKGKEYGMAWSEKLDGVSGMIVFKNGKVKGIYTRGDGIEGGNVTYLKDYIELPTPSNKYLVVRGEFVLSKETWKKYEGTYANARSFVSSKINSGFVSPSFASIEFIAYEIVDSSVKDVTPSKAYQVLSAEGFKTPVNGVFENPLIFDVVMKYTDLRKVSTYYIDGLVLTLNTTQVKESKAFKMILEEQLRDTKIINVDWNITRYGRYFPVAIYESVYIEGIRLHRASAHNARHIADWHMGEGTQITVARSGDVIPTIKDVKVDKETKPLLPDDTYTWHWSDSDKDILLDDIEVNEEVQIQRITHFFTTIQTPQLGEGRVRKLYDSGMNTIKKITSATIADLKKIKGFGDKLSRITYDNIHGTMRKTRLDRYFIAVTTFKTRVGRSLIKQIVRRFPDALTSTEEEILDFLNKNKIPGVGPKRKVTLSTAIPQFCQFLMDLNKDDIEYSLKYQERKLKQLEKEGYNEKIKGGSFVTTGFLTSPDYDLEDYIYDHWGDLSSTVTSGTTAVISANVANITGKMIKAHELKIPVYSVEEFLAEFNVPLKSKELPETIVVE